MQIEGRNRKELPENLPSISLNFGKDSTLPFYLAAPYVIPSTEQSRSESHDSNSENHPGNDYGDTPSSGSRNKRGDNSSGDDVDSDDEPNFEGKDGEKIKKLWRMMEKNKDNSSEEDEDDQGKWKYGNTAYDTWYGRDEEEY